MRNSIAVESNEFFNLVIQHSKSEHSTNSRSPFYGTVKSFSPSTLPNKDAFPLSQYVTSRIFVFCFIKLKENCSLRIQASGSR
ncbi:hypothetical protein K1719_015174 [Acacia pycnantha]|nr:hypothetical protein K1719_015174 [Acacia pycnantha]